MPFFLVKQRWLAALLCFWVVLLCLLSTQALAESVHHHDDDHLCQQHELLKRLNTPLISAATAVAVQAPIVCDYRITPISHCWHPSIAPCNRGPPALN